MPACPRSEVFDPTVVGCYYCTSTCVRRAALCGNDPLTGNNYDHRKDWIEQRLAFLASVMALDVLGNSAIADQHSVVLRNRPDLVEKWSDEEVARRWLRICPGSRDNLAENPPEPTQEQIEELAADGEKLAAVRGRLSHISWFMRFVNEYMSHRANQEEGEAKGRFWGGRFQCKSLLDIFALLLCAMYVDSKPMRAGVAATPEESRWTSAHHRIRGRDARLNVAFGRNETATGLLDIEADSWLAPIDANRPAPDGAQAELGRRASDEGFLELTLEEYLQLLSWTGQQIQLENADAAGTISAELAAILERLEIDARLLVEGVRSFTSWFSNFAGRAKRLLDVARRKGKRWIRGMSPARE